MCDNHLDDLVIIDIYKGHNNLKVLDSNNILDIAFLRACNQVLPVGLDNMLGIELLKL